MTIANRLMGSGVAALAAQETVGSVTSSATATGTTQTDALTFDTAAIYVTTTPSGSGVRLFGNAIRHSSTGDEQTVHNYGANALNVYPPVGDTIQGFSVNAALSVSTSSTCTFKKVDPTTWICKETYTASGTGAVSEPVQTALRRLPHSAQYSSSANFTAALNALTGTQGLAPTVQIGHSSGNPLTIGRGVQTFNSTVDRFSVFGYNVVTNGISIPDAADTSLGLMMESDFNDGSTHYAEIHFDMASPGIAYKRPFFAAMALSGPNTGKITETFLLGEQVSLYSPLALFQAAATYTSGAEFRISSLDTGGKVWSAWSSGSALTGGAGNLLFINTTNARYGLICYGGSTGGISVGLTGTAVTDVDGSAFIQLGEGLQGTGERTTIRWRNGGFATACDVNTVSNGDKSVYWNGTTLRIAHGIDSGISWSQCSGSGAVGFKWFGGTATTPVEQMRLASAGDFYTRANASELATNTTGGFVHIPSCNGAPSGTPATILTGAVPMIWDRANLQLYVYTGSAWKKSAAFT